jgi:hypothetical protein
MRQASHGVFDGIRQALFGFERRITRRFGIDLHLHVGDIRHRIDGEPKIIINAERCERGYRNEHEPAATYGKIDNAFKHGADPQWSWLAPDFSMSALIR